MATLFRPITIRYRLPNGKRVKKGTPGARKVKERSKKWYALYLDANDQWKRKPLCADKTAAQVMLADLDRKAQRERAGYSDPFEPHRQQPLGEHLGDYRRALEAKGDATKHVESTAAYIRAILDGCGFVRLSDLSASSVAEFLAALRRSGKSVRTSNAYLTAFKGFTRWLVRDRRMPDNPLSHLATLNSKVDRRHERRTLEVGEFAALVEAARVGKPFRGLSGELRTLLYIMAANTGLRASELASLTAASFDLAGDPATVTVEAAYSKHRRRDVLPLRADLVGRLCPVMSGFDSEASGVAQNRRSGKHDPEAQQGHDNATRGNLARRLWPGTWVEKPAKMLRRDLMAARAKYLKGARSDGEREQRERSSWLCYADEAGRVFDFHALRHQFISNLARGRVHPKEAQQLARHSTITLTLDTYTHLGIVDLAGALDALPALPSIDGPASETAELRATGTDGARRTDCLLVAQGVAQETGLWCPVVSLSDPEAGAGEREKNRENLGENLNFRGNSQGAPCRTRTYNPLIKSQML